MSDMTLADALEKVQEWHCGIGKRWAKKRRPG